MGRTAQAKAVKTHHVKAVKIEKKAQPTTTGPIGQVNSK
jgi:hypothetical protein